MKDLRVGIIGLGEAGQLHMDTWNKTPGAQVVALCDVRSEQALRLASTSVPCFTDAEDLFDSVTLDAVSLCSPTASHHPIGEMALARGISVLCEMPATPRGISSVSAASGPYAAELSASSPSIGIPAKTPTRVSNEKSQTPSRVP